MRSVWGTLQNNLMTLRMQENRDKNYEELYSLSYTITKFLSEKLGTTQFSTFFNYSKNNFIFVLQWTESKSYDNLLRITCGTFCKNKILYIIKTMFCTVYYGESL